MGGQEHHSERTASSSSTFQSKKCSRVEALEVQSSLPCSSEKGSVDPTLETFEALRDSIHAHQGEANMAACRKLSPPPRWWNETLGSGEAFCWFTLSLAMQLELKSFP